MDGTINNEDVIIGFFLVMIIGLIGLAINIFISYLLWDGVSRIPKENRTVEAYFAWLTLIPLVGIIFLWILLPFKIPESLKSYFVSQKKDSIDTDYGKAYGLGAMISFSCMIIPVINSIAWIPALVFLVLYMIQFRKFTQLLPSRAQNLSFTANNADKYSELGKLKKLLDEGALSSEEFEQEKRKLLGG